MSKLKWQIKSKAQMTKGFFLIFDIHLALKGSISSPNIVGQGEIGWLYWKSSPTYYVRVMRPVPVAAWR
jgi:hypothetical protein